MKAVNIYFLTRVREAQTASDYENILSDRDAYKRLRQNELESLTVLMDSLLSCSSMMTFSACGGFFFSFVIDHISKEFDLLKVAEDKSRILNIELKSGHVGEDRILRQLRQNRYYLSHISKNIGSYTFVSSTRQVFTIGSAGELTEISIENLAEVMNGFGPALQEDLDRLFSAGDFLVSPVNNPTAFLNGQYFLTDQQRDIRSRIRAELSAQGKEARIFAVHGSAGTGKTLLLYDIARTWSDRYRTLILSSGVLAAGHRILDAQMPGVVIKAAGAALKKEDFEGIDLVLTDESQRLRKDRFDQILEGIRSSGSFGIFFCDSRQILDPEEAKADIAGCLDAICDASYSLTAKIRINREMHIFLRGLFDLKKRVRKQRYHGISLLYARDREEAAPILEYYLQEGYVHIRCSREKGTVQEDVRSYAASRVIGQEFDRVIMCMDGRFYYDEEGKLRGRPGAAGELPEQLLYQGITRARDRLCLLVIGQEECFRKILSVLE